ncbi:MAG: acyl-ACP--UDP-N-acetylglucosamine O-acyltransferase [Deltaproteobacteria bacterium]|nr:acyl-ACP--UDP-N-acetylglucosamine O-acyltransferase [Deltaproteobacteria bacterium]
MNIHPTAIVDPTATLAAGVEVGAYAYIGPEVEIGPGSKISHHATVERWTKIGANATIWPHAALGGDPQDLKYEGEKTFLEVGDQVVVREFATLNRGTGEGGGVTRVGDGCLLMAYSHVAHDCQLGKGVVMANSANLAGHVIIEDRASLGGLVAVHQFSRIGTFCFLGGASAANKDLPPYTLCEGNRARVHGLNAIGLKRAGFTAETIDALKEAYRIIFRQGGIRSKVLEEARKEVPQTPEVVHFIEFIANSERGVARAV